MRHQNTYAQLDADWRPRPRPSEDAKTLARKSPPNPKLSDCAANCDSISDRKNRPLLTSRSNRVSAEDEREGLGTPSNDLRDDARAMLANIYDWFAEGFDTADLKDAKRRCSIS